MKINKNLPAIEALFLILTKTFFVASFFIILFLPQISQANADLSAGPGRFRTCDGAGVPDGLSFDPTSGGKDAEFNLSNPICLTVIATSYAAVKGSIAFMNSVCGSGSPIPRLTPSPLLDAHDIFKATRKIPGNGSCGVAVASATASLFTAVAEIGVIYTIAKQTYDNSEVCGANWIVPNPSEYNISAARYKKTIETFIEDNKNDPTKLTFSEESYREWYYNGVEVEDNPSEGESCLDVAASIAAPYHKQKYYMRGLQSGNFNCSKYDILDGQNDPADPTIPVTPERLALFRKAYDCCKYRSQEFICIKFRNVSKFCKSNNNCTINTGTNNDFSDVDFRVVANNVSLFALTTNVAYDTATGDNSASGFGNNVLNNYANAATNTADLAVNLANNTDISQRVIFTVKPVDGGRLLCASTYSLCPYNFFLSGGSDVCDYYKDGVKDSDGNWTMITPTILASKNCSNKSVIRNGDCTYNDKAGQCINYCQYLRHCTTVGSSNYKYRSELTSPYFDTACLNFVGDSMNRTAYGTGFILGSQRHFSAPIAQCVKETLENLFYNKVGHTGCAGQDELVAADGTCPSGNYVNVDDGFSSMQKGNTAFRKSFFSTIQDGLRSAVKMALTLSVMFFGMKVLLGMAELKKSELLMYLLKFGLVLYFATGDAWQTTFFRGVYDSSSYFSELVFKINVSGNENQRDGCQFGSLTLENGTKQVFTRYPAGKNYLAIWDTLDCKMARYLGFGPSVSVANLAKLIAAGAFSGGWGIYFSLSVMFFGFFLIATTIRGLHIFLSSLMSIVLMVFISPLVIPTVLFTRTNAIFKSWLTNLISFCLQPMILFAYIAIFLTIMDKTLIGSATFHGPSPSRIMSCTESCQEKVIVNGVDTGAVRLIKDDSCTEDNMDTIDTARDLFNVGTCQTCDKPGQTLINPLNDSLACLVNANRFGKFPGLEMFGLTIPILINIFDSNVKERLLTILKGVFIMYILCKFMDEIPEITSQLIGGTKLPSENFSAKNMFTGTAGLLKGIQKRGYRGAKKLLGKGGAKVKRGAGDVGNKGKKADDAGGGDKGDRSHGASSSDGTKDAPPPPPPGSDAGSSQDPSSGPTGSK